MWQTLEELRKRFVEVLDLGCSLDDTKTAGISNVADHVAVDMADDLTEVAI